MTAALAPWVQLTDFPDYEVNASGQIQSRKRGGPRLLRPLAKGNGYPSVNLYADGRCATKAIHLLVAEAFLGLRPAGAEVRHLNGNRADFRLVNLSWGSRAENEQDKKLHGTSGRKPGTRCFQGHPLSQERAAGRSKACMSCRRERHARARHETAVLLGGAA